MNLHESDWQGFQSFNETPQYGEVKAAPLQPQEEQQLGEERHEEKPNIQKKMTFRSKNKRKSSFISTFQSKKSVNHLVLPKAIPQKSVQIEKPRKVSLVLQKRQEGIPIFRETEYPSQGQMIYKNGSLSTVQQYFTRNNQERTHSFQHSDLSFNSRFQSGNLEQVIKRSTDYHLYITVDTNTKGHKQWFYFHVLSREKRTARFVIHSFKKRLSLFQLGMRPYGKYREQSYEMWRPVGSNVRYIKSMQNHKRNAFLRKPEFNLVFDIDLQENIELCIASCIPYSYSFLHERIKTFSFSTFSKLDIKQGILCKTLTGLKVPLITVNEPATLKSHRYIVINARTHPGESSASWVLDGLLNELISSTIVQNLILEFNIVLKIVPMLNVEGVFMGNYRTGVMGVDFNRLFLSGSPDLFPEIGGLKKLVEQCKSKGKVDLFLDLHGHSILPGCFMYGPDPLFAPKTPLRMLVKEMSKSRYFTKNHCVLGVDSAKTETSRIYFQVQEGIFSLTCENSLGLYYKNNKKGKQTQFQSKDLQEFGKDLLNIVLNVYDQSNLDEKDRFQEKDELLEALNEMHLPEEEEYMWEKSKTDTGKIEDQLCLLAQLELQEIDLPNQLTLSHDHSPQQNQSFNDSDSESENLSLQKQQELIKIVRKTIAKNHPPSITTTHLNERSLRQLSRMAYSKGKYINNFKEYRFGVEDTTINDWYARKRILSIPRHLKTEKQSQSYLIRKKPSRSITQDQLPFEPMEITKRVMTQQKQQMRRSFIDNQSKKKWFWM